MPLILDDTKLAKKGDHVGQLIYEVANGRGRGRGSVKGLAATSTWATVLISSGETPITSFTEDGGTRARVLPFWGSPFGGTDVATAEAVRAIDAGIKANFGHLGPQFVRFLIENRDEWPEWRECYRLLRAEHTAAAWLNAVVGRLAAHIAMLELTAVLVETAFDGLRWMSPEQFATIGSDMSDDANNADPFRWALQYAYAWAASHENDFFGRHNLQGEFTQSPACGWAGNWSNGLPHEWRALR